MADQFNVLEVLLEPDEAFADPIKRKATAAALRKQNAMGVVGQLMGLAPTQAAGTMLQDQSQTSLKAALAKQQAQKEAEARASEAKIAQQRWEAQQAMAQKQFDANERYRQQQLGATYAGLDLRREAAQRAADAAASAKEAKDLAAGAKVRQERQGVSRALASGEENLRTIDQALQHPGRKAATGASGVVASRLPFTEARNFQSIHNKLIGGAFLQAFESLKGGGQITEIEGKKATDAITRINTPGLTEAEYEMALNELRNVVVTGIDRAKQEGYEVGMFKDLPGLPSGNPAAQGQPGAFGLPAQPAGSAARRWLDQVEGG
jgi:hypothetical protein